ncbi:hypothetical protein Droror1_Dr00019288 [Drosera rotundifolia]
MSSHSVNPFCPSSLPSSSSSLTLAAAAITIVADITSSVSTPPLHPLLIALDFLHLRIEGTVCLGDLVHAHVVVLGFERDGYIRSALVEMYATRGDMGCARKVFDKMLERDTVVGTGMVDGYGKVGEVEEA